MTGMSGLSLDLGLEIARRSSLLNFRVLASIAGYQIGAVALAIFDGVGLLLLVSLMTSGLGATSDNLFLSKIVSLLQSAGIQPDFSLLLLVVVACLATGVLLSLSLDIADAKFVAYSREHIQRSLFRAAIGAKWVNIYSFRVGQLATTFTDEAQITSKFLLSIVRFIYFTIRTAVFGVLALMVNVEISLVLLFIGVPLFLILRLVFSRQSRLSIEQMKARQRLAADVTERFSNLFHIKTARSESMETEKGLNFAKPIAALEVQIGWGSAFMNSFHIISILAALGIISAWSYWRGSPLEGAFAGLASVGVLGYRASGQINNVMVSLGNLARLSGSLNPVAEILRLPQAIQRVSIPEPVTALELIGVTFRHIKGPSSIRTIEFRVGRAQPLVIRGPSGSGKTTIANLACGLYQPDDGIVCYFGQSGARYDASRWAARISYVTQDVMLFQASVRDNIRQENTEISDAELWSILEKVGAVGFVRERGGLDAILVEGGRSLSGGERRRLALARALAARPDILIFDEIMSGLDSELKVAIGMLMETLSASLVVIAITHDPDEAFSWQTLELTI
jgi:ABC-type multidrug transport system fused ATPase/permease subunit